MKRLLATIIAIVCVSAMCIIPASAADSYNLIPKGATWTTTPCEGYDITVTDTDDATVFTADGYWPAANTVYSDDGRVTVDIDEYSLVYDFTVEVGQTNINFSLTDGFGGSEVYSICNNALGEVPHDSGSGDLYAGEYKGVIRLSDLANSTMFLQGRAFPKSIIVDNCITFTGIQVYSVSSATVTVRTMAIVPNDEAGEPSTGEDESEEVLDESSEEATESSEAVTESSEAATESDAESEAASEAESTPDDTVAEEGLGIWLWVIIAAGVIIVVSIVVIIVSKKK